MDRFEKYPDIFFLPEWGKAFQELDNGEANIFEFKNDNGHIYYQFIKRRIPHHFNLSGYFDIITPYGFNGPVVLFCKDNRKEQLISEYNEEFLKYCIHENIISEYVRFSPWLKNHLDFGNQYDLKYNNYTLHTDLTVNDFFMEEFHKRVRNKIRVASKRGVTVEYDFTGSSLTDFFRLYQMTGEKNNFSDYYRFSFDFLANTIGILGNRQYIINARFENRCISSRIVLDYGEYVHDFLAGNDYLYIDLNANSLILYEMACRAKAQGKKQLQMGGAFSDSLFAFKKQFTKKGFCDFFIGKRIINKQIYSDIVEKRISMENNIDPTYFPLYRG